MKYEAISKLIKEFSVVKMCRALGVKPQNYYRWIQQERKNKEKHVKQLSIINRVEEIFNDSDQTYGYRAIKKEIEEKGIYLSEYKIRKIMRANGFYPQTSKKYKPIHNGKTDGKYYDNRLKQKFKTNKPNQAWAGDITYIRTSIGWVYLAVVIDLFNREVIGYGVSKKINGELVKQALANAIARRGTEKDLIFHSDRGCQYASKTYQQMLKDNGISESMSRPGCPYDNACSESFFATLKKERIYRKSYVGLEDFKRDMFRYIEIFYNRKRRHSYLGYVSPVKYLMRYEAVNIA